MPAAFAGAIDLSALKKRASAPPTAPGAAGGAPSAGAADAGPLSPYVVDVDEATFGSVLQASSQVLVVVDLWAEWAEPGKPLSAILQKLAAAAGGSWILARVDVDANPRIVAGLRCPVAADGDRAGPGSAGHRSAHRRVAGTAGQAMDLVAAGRAARTPARYQGGGGAQRGGGRRKRPNRRKIRGSWRPKRRWPTATTPPRSWPTSRSWPSSRRNAEAKAALAQTGLLARVEQLPPGRHRQGRRGPGRRRSPTRCRRCCSWPHGDVERRLRPAGRHRPADRR